LILGEKKEAPSNNLCRPRGKVRGLGGRTIGKSRQGGGRGGRSLFTQDERGKKKLNCVQKVISKRKTDVAITRTQLKKKEFYGQKKINSPSVRGGGISTSVRFESERRRGKKRRLLPRVLLQKGGPRGGGKKGLFLRRVLKSSKVVLSTKGGGEKENRPRIPKKRSISFKICL